MEARTGAHKEETPEVKLVTASGDPLPIISHIQAPVQVGNFRTIHHFVVVDCLIYPVIATGNFYNRMNLSWILLQ